jgi:hypothetical protein
MTINLITKNIQGIPPRSNIETLDCPINWWVHATPFSKGMADFFHDIMENSPFASVGGLDKRQEFIRPTWIINEEWPEYKRGYETQAEEEYGKEWKTCCFKWIPAIAIKIKIKEARPFENFVDPRVKANIKP